MASQLAFAAMVVLISCGEVSAQQYGRRRGRHGRQPTPAPTPPLPGPHVGLESLIQMEVDNLVKQMLPQFPDLAVSVAFKSATHDVAIASGKPKRINRLITTNDTFLYGSGTKPFTATAIFRLIDQGKVKETDKVFSIVDPYLKRQGKPSLAEFFGEAINAATVLDVVRMGTGIRDFEDSDQFDKWVLSPKNSSKFNTNYPYETMSWSTSPQNAQGGGPLYFKPGHGTAYSSTGFEVAGLILAAVLEPNTPWYSFDLGSAIFDNRTEYPSLVFPPKGRGAKLSTFLTVPGQSTSGTWEKATIFEQDPSILGWTCGNMVASPRDVAKFFYHLLDSDAAHADKKPLISDSSRAEMTTFKTVTAGWNADSLLYGAGLMHLSYRADEPTEQTEAETEQTQAGHRRRKGRGPHEIVFGHEGDTYGFLSSEGYIPSLKAGFSVASNYDNSKPMEAMVRRLLGAVIKELAPPQELVLV